MDAAGQEPVRRPYVLGLVILVPVGLLLLFVMSSAPTAGPHRAWAASATGGDGALAGLSAAPSSRREGFLLSFDPVGLTGPSSRPPPAKVAPPRHPS